MEKYLEDLSKREKPDPTSEFAKQSARPHLFLSPEQLELLEERRIAEEKRMQKAQRYSEVLRNNEKNYIVPKTWQVSFDSDYHKKINKVTPLMREMMRAVYSNANHVKLSHQLIS